MRSLEVQSFRLAYRCPGILTSRVANQSPLDPESVCSHGLGKMGSASQRPSGKAYLGLLTTQGSAPIIASAYESLLQHMMHPVAAPVMDLALPEPRELLLDSAAVTV